MKKLILFLILIIILGGATPLVGGYIFKGDFDKFITALSQDNSTQVRVVEYKSGWLSSHAKIVIEPRGTDSGMSNLPKPQITIEQDIAHGPLVYDKANGFTFAEAIVQSQVHFQPFETLLGIPNDQGIMQVSTKVDYDDTYWSRFTSPPFTKSVPDKFMFSWQGIQGTADVGMVKDKIDRVNMKATLSQINFDIANGAYNLKLVNGSGQTNMKATNLPGLWNSDHSDMIGQVSYSEGGKDVLTIDNLNTVLKTNVDNNLFDFAMNINIGRMNFTDQIEIKPARFNLTINDLSGTGIIKMSDIPPVRRDQRLAVLPDIVTPTSSVKSDLTLDTSRGRLFVTADVNWKGQVMPIKMEEMQNKTNAQIDLRISSTLLNYFISMVDYRMNPDAMANPAAPPAGTTDNTNPSTGTNTNATNPRPTMQSQVTNLINQGYLTKDKEDYTSQIVITQGKVKINGKDYVDLSTMGAKPVDTSTPTGTDAPATSNEPSSTGTDITSSPTGTVPPTESSPATPAPDSGAPATTYNSGTPPAANSETPPTIEEAKPVGTESTPTIPPKPIPKPNTDVPIDGKPFTIEQDPRNQT